VLRLVDDLEGLQAEATAEELREVFRLAVERVEVHAEPDGRGLQRSRTRFHGGRVMLTAAAALLLAVLPAQGALAATGGRGQDSSLVSLTRAPSTGC